MGRLIILVDVAVLIFFLWVIYKIVLKIRKELNK